MDTDSDDSIQMSRMLILLDVFATRNRNGVIEGINRIAIYDFLLKYPYAFSNFIRRQELSITIQNHLTDSLHSYETDSIESKTMKYNFAPWDYKYRRVISILESKRLVDLQIGSKKAILQITELGTELAGKLYAQEQHQIIKEKCKILKRHFSTWSQKRMVEKIYEVFPEILQLKTELDVTE